ncbi:hypothetical protein B0H17DRAFT_1012810 [Mycena rosella]|uniref:BTB domain-containing protein n=1 Tax=Mycena rosella TaxID=1033263 RepID=A0AAD7DCD5_MYCRO|nr:hypothetical protein B0H17DRAFT_1012810 [Mycena rosella]
MEVNPGAAEPRRVEELWFEEGGLIIRAQACLFRVPRGILAARSPIFADMLSCPQPPDSEALDGCPVVEIPDAAADVTVFLKAIFDSSFFEAYPHTTNFATVSAILRLSAKYEVEHLRRRALTHLSSRFPTTLSDWDVRADDEGPLWRRSSWHDDISEYICIATIQLCREIHAPWILPSAFYMFCSENPAPQVILHGTQAPHVELGDHDKAVFFAGQLLQHGTETKDVGRFLYFPSTIDTCVTPKRCGKARLAALEGFWNNYQEFPSMPLDIWDENDWDDLGICSICRGVLEKIHQEAREACWDRLPGVYGLPSRKDLEAMKKTAGVL